MADPSALGLDSLVAMKQCSYKRPRKLPFDYARGQGFGVGTSMAHAPGPPRHGRSFAGRLKGRVSFISRGAEDARSYGYLQPVFGLRAGGCEQQRWRMENQGGLQLANGRYSGLISQPSPSQQVNSLGRQPLFPVAQQLA